MEGEGKLGKSVFVVYMREIGNKLKKMCCIFLVFFLFFFFFLKGNMEVFLSVYSSVSRAKEQTDEKP